VAARPDLVAREEEERANMWSPRVSDRQERRRCGSKVETHEGNIFLPGAKVSLSGRLDEAVT
jgi:hypothetical protein